MAFTAGNNSLELYVDVSGPHGHSKCKNYILPRYFENIHMDKVSGFSLLAKNLKSKPDIVDQLMKE